MKEKVELLVKELNEKISKVTNTKELNDLKIEYIGKKGIITELQSGIKDVKPEEKKEYGMNVNILRNAFNESYEEKLKYLTELEINEKLESERIDVTLPSKRIRPGSKHPMTRIQEELEDLFVSMGFDVYDGPEIETDEVCFQKLNLPLGHPARDSQDTFYLENEYEKYLLRTQTSTGQVRVMEANKEKGPIRVVCPGKVYRRDDDATHSHQFMQMEGLVIDKDISLSDLKGTLETFCKKLLGEKTDVRFRPSFFPFTEPSVEVDATCFKCGGKGCPLCKQTGWIEVLGAGMVHPNVLRMSGYDPEKYQGFAFGTGLDRFTMFRFGITDIRTIYGNDVRFLNQFSRKDEGNETK